MVYFDLAVECRALLSLSSDLSSHVSALDLSKEWKGKCVLFAAILILILKLLHPF